MVKGSGRRRRLNDALRRAGVRKPPKNEPAGGVRARLVKGYGDLAAATRPHGSVGEPLGRLVGWLASGSGPD
jgi:hypothetical protein